MKQSAISISDKILRWFLAVAAIASLAPLYAVAQSGDVISAQYGADRRWANVTNQVRGKIRNGSLNFRINNDAFGVGDPAPGVVKTLRLRVREYNNQTRDYTYQENQQVSLQLGGNGPGYPNRPGGPGYSNYNLRSDDQSRFDSYYTRWLNYKRTNNSGEVRSMEKRMYDIYNSYRIPTSVPFYQVASPNVAQPEPGWGGGNPGWGGDNPGYGNLRVFSARYGSGGRGMDVTGRVQSMVRNGSLRFRVNNDSMGGDPAPGQTKQLYMQYSYNGQNRNGTYRENDEVRIP
jgi:hypothetical protein